MPQDPAHVLKDINNLERGLPGKPGRQMKRLNSAVDGGGKKALKKVRGKKILPDQQAQPETFPDTMEIQNI